MNEKAQKKADLKGLFAKAEKADASLEQARQAVEDSIKIRSEAVKAIHEATSSKGPFKTPEGKLVTIRTRSTKDDEGNVTGQTWFFVGQGDSEVIEI